MNTQLPTAQSQALQPLTQGDPRQIGSYRLSARLGAGGMGFVYLAHTPGGRPVALKVIRPELATDPEFRHRFAQEVASARRIHGLYTAQVIDAGPADPTPWLATTFVSGPSLQHVIHHYGLLPERTALLLLVGIAEALQAIHAAGVVHRDLKPANVLIAPDGPKVIDFGIARAADAVALTGTGLRIGSPGFMAPEQILGRPATPATDVFALGALITHTATGRAPFGDGPEHAALYRAVHEQPNLTGLSSTLHDLVSRCLAKDPAERPSTEWVIETARNHAAADGAPLSFTDGWLPAHISADISRHTASTHPPATEPDPAAGLAGAPTPLPAPPQPSAPSRRRRPARQATTRRTAFLAALALLGGVLLLYALPDNAESTEEGPDAALPTTLQPSAASATAAPPTGSPHPKPDDYTVQYTDRELTSPDSDYEIDLSGGRVTRETPDWYLGREAGEFYVPNDSITYIPPTGTLTLADCLTGLDTQPASALPFTTLRTNSTFCIRAYGNRDIAVVRILNNASNDGPIKVAITHYRRTA
ncbi:serine/threonine-protein kinase [Streptomyces sp. NPDC001373]|uniref:serine/threonine-protein kinase n=1 Tax=Streptomyces sp. NPDC001373 TaxID=3364565 RepID=UPI0036C75C77